MKYYCLNCGSRIKLRLLSEDRELDAFECEQCGAYPPCFNCALCAKCAPADALLAATQ